MIRFVETTSGLVYGLHKRLGMTKRTSCRTPLSTRHSFLLCLLLIAAGGLACSSKDEIAARAVQTIDDETTLQEAKEYGWTVVDGLPSSPPYLAASPLGGIPGDFAVTPEGSASYSVPLFVPRGPGGLTPEITLRYDSNQGAAGLGAGWSLMASSSPFYRCNKTFARDGFRSAPQKTLGDAICFGGTRIVRVQGDLGENGSEYRTERDTYAKIELIAHATESQRMSGFKVWRRDGLIETYGESPTCDPSGSGAPCEGGIYDSDSTPIAWYLKRTEDRYGNAITFAYDAFVNQRPLLQPPFLEVEELLIKSIAYGDREVSFAYVPDPNPAFRFTNGQRSTSSKLLDRIDVSADGQLYRRYLLTYLANSIDRRSRLFSIGESDQFGISRATTTLTYPPVAEGFSDNETTLPASVHQYVNSAATCLYQGVAKPPYVLDANGDGYDDLAYPRDGFLFIRFGSDTGLGQEEQLGSAHELQRAAVSDLNGDGRDDLLLLGYLDGGSVAPTWHAWLSTSSGLQRTDLGVPLPSVRASCVVASVPDLAEAQNIAQATTVIDFDGNGLKDLLVCNDSNTFDLYLTQAGQPLFSTQVGVTGIAACKDLIGAADVDADGVDEIVFEDPAIEMIRYMDWTGGAANGSPFPFSAFNTGIPAGTADPTYRFIDINGDGLRDLTGANDDPGVFVWINTGDGFFGRPPQGSAAEFTDGFKMIEATDLGLSNSATPLARGRDVLGTAKIYDYDGDGREDLLISYSGTCGQPPGIGISPFVCWDTKFLVLRTGTMEFLLDGSEGAIVQAEPVPNLDQDAGYATRARRIGDFNGDLVPDYLKCNWAIINRTAQFFDMELHIHPGIHLGGSLGRLSEVHERDTDVPTYRMYYDHTDQAVSLSAPTDCTYPNHCRRPRRPIVSRFEIDGGPNDGPRIFTRSADQPKYNSAGEGWLGFGSIAEEENTASGAVLFRRVTSFGRNTDRNARGHYPFVFAPTAVSEQTNIDGGQPLTSQSTLTYYYQDGNAFNDHYSVAAASRSLLVHDGPELIRQSDMSMSPPDEYGNVLSRTVATPDLAQSTITTWDPQNDEWLLPRALRTETTSTEIASSASKTRVVERTYNPGTLSLSQMVISPHVPAEKLTTDYAYDDFGNAIERIETAAQNPFESRRALTIFDRDGLWPVFFSNAEAHQSAQRVDPVSGESTVSQDENAVVTTTQINGFGEVQNTNSADGTHLSLQRFENPVGHHAEAEWFESVSSTGTNGRSTVFFDRLGRAMRLSRHQGSTEYFTDVGLDQRGRRRSVSLPYQAGETTTTFNSYQYDNADRLERSYVPVLLPWTYPETKNEFAGRTTITTLPSGLITRREHDLSGRVIRQQEGSQPWVELRYGPFNEVKAVSSGAYVFAQQTFDTWGRRMTATHLGSGTRTTTYNAFGEVVSELDAKGVSMLLDRDRLGRLTWRTYTYPGGGAETSTWIYDQGTGGIGNLSSHAGPAPDKAAQFAYDAFGRLETAERAIGGELYRMSYAYDSQGRLERQTYPERFGETFEIRLEYNDSDGHVSSVYNETTGDAYWMRSEADGYGRTTHEIFGNGTETHSTYARYFPLLVDQQTTSPSSPDAHFTYGYDIVGSLRYRFDRSSGDTAEYRYDVHSRVAAQLRSQYTGSGSSYTPPATNNGVVDDSWSCTSCNTQQTWLYDDLDRIVADSLTGIRYYASANDPFALTGTGVLGSGVFNYDANGNQEVSPSQNRAFTAFNMLENTVRPSGEYVHYEYDAENALASRSILNASGELEVEHVIEDAFSNYFEDPNFGNRERANYYITVGSRLTARIERTFENGGLVDEATSYFHPDHRGHLSVVSDDSGNLVDHWNGNAFGEGGAPPIGTPVAVGKHTYEGVSNLIHMNARHASPDLGVFISPDPIVADVLNRASWNPYAYVYNNPMTLIDPAGLQATTLRSDHQRQTPPSLGTDLDWLRNLFTSGEPNRERRNFNELSSFGATGFSTFQNLFGPKTVSGGLSIAGDDIGYVRATVDNALAGVPDYVGEHVQDATSDFDPLRSTILATTAATDAELAIAIPRFVLNIDKAPGMIASIPGEAVGGIEQALDGHRVGNSYTAARGYSRVAAATGAGLSLGAGVVRLRLNLASGRSLSLAQRIQLTARVLGYRRRIAPQRAPFNSMGKPVFSNGRGFITPDRTGHRGGFWKVYDRRGNRIGTYDRLLKKRIGN